MSRYRFHGRFSRLRDVHMQMERAGCLDGLKDELDHGHALVFPPSETQLVHNISVALAVYLLAWCCSEMVCERM